VRNLKENDDAIRSRRHDDGVPRPLELVAGGSMALMFAALFVMLLLRAPHTVWAVLLAAALTMLAGVLALGLLQWGRGRSGRTLSHGRTGAHRGLLTGASDGRRDGPLVEEGSVLSADEQEWLLDIERRFAVDDPKFGRSFRSRQRGLSDHYERKAVRIAVLVAGLLSALVLLAVSLTGGLTFGTAGGLLGWMAALAFAIATVLPGWMLRRNSTMRRSARDGARTPVTTEVKARESA
jgi:hypothetical protein